MRYNILLIDADDTVLDFQKNELCALQETFQKYDLVFNKEVHKTYRTINHKLWAAFEAGEITKDQIFSRRFRNTFAALGVKDPLVGFEEEYQLALGRGGYVIAEAMEVCKRLSQTCRLYIVTNGDKTTQVSRMERSGLLPYISDMFVSEAIGYQKPQKEYFDYVFSNIPNFDSSRALMIGDSLNSDMRGGQNAGLDVCWYNPNGLSNAAKTKLDYEITDLRELYDIVGES